MEDETVTQNIESQPLQSLENLNEQSLAPLSLNFNALFSREIQLDLEDKPKFADFHKSIEFAEDQNFISCLTENNVLLAYKLLEGKGETGLETLLKERFSTPIYDQALINKREKLVIALSKRDHPVTFYEVFNLGMQQKLNPVLSIKEYRKNSETFLTPYKMKIDSQMENLYGGGDRYFFGFDIERSTIWRSSLMKERTDIVSALDIPSPSSSNFESTKDIIAIGKFDKSISIYSKKDDVVLGTLKAHIGGITSLLFSKSDSFYLYSGARKDDLVYVWDLRKFTEFLTYYERKCNTNQRLNFDLDHSGNLIHLGSQDGSLSSFDTKTGKLAASFKAHDDCVNGIKVLKSHGARSGLLASCSGQRIFNILKDKGNMTEESSESSDDEWSEEDDHLIVESIKSKQNSLKLWSYSV